MAAFGLACLLSACTTAPPIGTSSGTPRIVERDLSGSAASATQRAAAAKP